MYVITSYPNMTMPDAAAHTRGRHRIAPQGAIASRKPAGFRTPGRLTALLAISLVMIATAVAAATEEATAEVAPSLDVTIRQGPAIFPSSDRTQASMRVTFPGKTSALLSARRADWFNLSDLVAEIFIAADAPTNVLAMTHVIDRDGQWFQRYDPDFLQPGITNRVVFAFSPQATGWEKHGHHNDWHARSMLDPQEVALDLYSDSSYTGQCAIVSLTATHQQDTRPPEIGAVRPGPRMLGTFDMYELRLQLPDRYRDPFNSDEVHLTARFSHDGTHQQTVDGFYYQGFFRTSGPTGERIVAQGRPEWRVRYAPPSPGDYSCTLTVRDTYGETSHVPIAFTVTNSVSRGPARISKRDTRYFETSDGAFLFPIGHNIRSPFDVRMDSQFPMRFRKPEGSMAYVRYFRDMHKYGSNFAEIWSCAWSMGLEWTPRDRGYHGVGDYNLEHAWELDKVLELARGYGIYINLVLNNHGRLSTYCDEEWDDNPYNRQNGGYLSDPMQFFDDKRAIKDTEKLCRYMVARYAANVNIFAWELWSELDLIGHGRTTKNPHYQERVVDWHDHFARYIREIDPLKHLIATHVSGNFQVQNPAIVSLPSLDHAPIDAYHHNNDPISIVTLIKNSVAHNARFNKPVIITEFGGSPMANSTDYLEKELHCALWTSTCAGLGATPLFWWWQLIEEANFYPMYAAVGRFMKGVDLRDPTMQLGGIEITRVGTQPPYPISAQGMRSQDQAIGWIYASTLFGQLDIDTAEEVTGQTLQVMGLADGIFRVVFVNTLTGLPISQRDARADDGKLTTPIPTFRRDTAFKIMRRN